MKLKFRRAESKDVYDIVRMLTDDKLGISREELQQPLPKSYMDAFYRIAEDNNQYLVVVEDDQNEVVGTMQISFIQYLTFRGGLRAQIEAVRIRRDKRGLGIGNKMFIWAIERAKEKGAHLMQLTTNKQRTDAKRFYERLGFIGTHEGMKLNLTND